MADNDDHESKTEDATEKRKQDAVDKGERPAARDVGVFLFFVALATAVGFASSGSGVAIIGPLRSILDISGFFVLSSPAAVFSALYGSLSVAAILVGSIAALTSLAPIVGQFGQGELRMVASRIAPDWKRLNVGKNFVRMFSKKGLLEFLRSALKTALLLTFSAVILWKHAYSLTDFLTIDSGMIAAFMLRVIFELATAFALTHFVFAGFEILTTRLSWLRSIRMTREDVKREAKESEGDPHIKARQRSISLQRNRQRMLSDVARATVVLANPTHFSIALRYVREEGGAPVVVAKGQDLVALAIRQRAEALGIPVVENPPLVRSMYKRLDVGQMIPHEFYKAIAEVINYLAKGAQGHAAR